MINVVWHSWKRLGITCSRFCWSWAYFYPQQVSAWKLLLNKIQSVSDPASHQPETNYTVEVSYLPVDVNFPPIFLGGCESPWLRSTQVLGVGSSHPPTCQSQAKCGMGHSISACSFDSWRDQAGQQKHVFCQRFKELNSKKGMFRKKIWKEVQQMNSKEVYLNLNMCLWFGETGTFCMTSAVRYVKERRKSCWGLYCCDQGRESKTVPWLKDRLFVVASWKATWVHCVCVGVWFFLSSGVVVVWIRWNM